jgi:branched-chain amino acid transport system permease protein
MQNYLAEFGDWVAMSQAVIFITCVLAFRKGIVGEIGSAFRVKL